MEQPSIFYEIEMKALLTREDYERLFTQLPEMMEMFNEETIHTTKYKPDVRLRHSDKTIEIVCKEGDPTKISRREVVIPLASKEKLDHFAHVFTLMQLQSDPPWTKHKREFKYHFNGYDYIVCLQHIENFAYLLEVEYLSETDDAHIHESNLRGIIQELGCEPIDPIDFSQKIKEYIANNE